MMENISNHILYDDESESDSEAPSFHDENNCGDCESNKERGYFYHHFILPSDTFQGICLQYKISATKLRQINMFSGSSLRLAPKRLKIPVHSGITSYQNTETEEYKTHFLQSEFPHLNSNEIRDILKMHEWNIDYASYSIQTRKEEMEKNIDVQRKNRETLDKRKSMVDGITKEIPISFFGNVRDMNYIQDRCNMNYSIQDRVYLGDIELMDISNRLC